MALPVVDYIAYGYGRHKQDIYKTELITRSICGLRTIICNAHLDRLQVRINCSPSFILWWKRNKILLLLSVSEIRHSCFIPLTDSTPWNIAVLTCIFNTINVFSPIRKRWWFSSFVVLFCISLFELLTIAPPSFHVNIPFVFIFVPRLTASSTMQNK